MTDSEKEQFAKRLRNLVYDSRYTQKQIAALCGITEATLSRYLSGDRVPKAEILANLANILHTTSDELLGRQNPYSDFAEIKTLVARSSEYFTESQKQELSDILLGINKRLGNGNGGEW